MEVIAQEYESMSQDYTLKMANSVLLYLIPI